MHLDKCINFSFLSIECLICDYVSCNVCSLHCKVIIHFHAHNTIKFLLAIADIEEDTASIQSVSSVPSLFPTPLATPTTETPDVQPEEGRGEGGRESDSQAVAIAVSTSLLTVLAVAVIVAVGVILCWRISSKNRYLWSSSLLRYSYIMHGLICNAIPIVAYDYVCCVDCYIIIVTLCI